MTPPNADPETVFGKGGGGKQKEQQWIPRPQAHTTPRRKPADALWPPPPKNSSGLLAPTPLYSCLYSYVILRAPCFSLIVPRPDVTLGGVGNPAVAPLRFVIGLSIPSPHSPHFFRLLHQSGGGEKEAGA